MAPKQTQNLTFHILDAAKTQPYVAALRSVRPELAAMAEIDVRPAVDEVVALLHAQLERVEAAKAVGGEPDARVLRLELLVLALARAQYELLWAPPRKPVVNYDALVADAQRAFRFLEQLVTAHVRLGNLQRADLPRARRGQMTERCLADQAQLARCA